MRMIILAAAASAALSGAAFAAPGQDSLVISASRLAHDNQRIVSAADLNLATEEGRAMLHRRVGLAIADLCDARRFSVAEPHDSMRCTAETWAATAPQIERLAPRLAAR